MATKKGQPFQLMVRDSVAKPREKRSAVRYIDDLDALPADDGGGNILVEKNGKAYKRKSAALADRAITVGANGDYTSIKEALDFIATQTLMDEVDIGALTVDIAAKTNIATFSADPVNIIRPGDLLYLDNDANPTYAAAGTYTEHWYPILRVCAQGALDFDAVLAMGLVGSAKSTYAPKVYRPRKFVVILLDQLEIDPASAPKIPDGCDITITSLGTGSMYNESITKSAGNEGSMEVQRYGYTTIRNLVGNPSALLKAGDDVYAFPFIEEGHCFLTMQNIQMYSDWAFGNSITLAGLVANDVYIHSIYDHTFIPSADYMVVDGWSVQAREITDVMSIGAIGGRSSTHRKKLRNINCERYNPDPYRPGYAGAIRIRGGLGDANGDMFYDIQNLNIMDHANLSPAVHYNLMVEGSTGGGTNTVNINGGTLGSTHADHLGHIQVAANAKLRMRDVKDLYGKQPIVVSNAGTIEWLDHNGWQDLSYSATISPDIMLGRKIIVGELTGNITTINNIAGTPVKGERATFAFAQDGTGSRTLNWSGSAYKVHSNPVGGASEKAIYEFEFDGTDWVQVNATAWA